MDIGHGFTLDTPAVTISWDSTEADAQRLIGSSLRRVTAGYWTAPVEALGGLHCQLGFQFDKARGLLEELEFFRDSYANAKESFDEFQSYFERIFGRPNESLPGTEGFPAHRWIVSGVEIRHFIFYHFGVTPQALVALRFIAGGRAMFDLGAREYYVSGLGSDDARGSETIFRGDVGVNVRLVGGHTVGLRYVSSTRDARYGVLPDKRFSEGTVTLADSFLGSNHFSAVKW